MRRRSLKRQKIFIIASSLSLLLFLTIGYAAFQTNITLKAKGNIKKTAEPITIEQLREKVVTEGDGLYADSSEEGRYLYRGFNSNNKITFNNELWRIISIESDGSLKIIKSASTTATFNYDPGYSTAISGVTEKDSIVGTRYTNKDTDFCFHNTAQTSYPGCNVWGSKTTMLNTSGANVTSMPKEIGSSTTYNLPEKEAYINTYLNETWYNSLNEESKNLVNNHTWDVGPIKSATDLTTTIQQASAYKWKGKVGLIQALDYVKANSNETCRSVSRSSTNCGTNWLNGRYILTMTAFSDSTSNNIYKIDSFLQPVSSYSGLYIKPVLYLTPNITLSGEGTEDLPYTINEQ